MSTPLEPKTDEDKAKKEGSEKAPKVESTEKKRGFFSKLIGGAGGFLAGVVMAPFAAVAGFVSGLAGCMKQAWKEGGGPLGGFAIILGALNALTAGVAAGVMAGAVIGVGAAVSSVVYTPYAGWKGGATGIIRAPVDMYNYMTEPRSKRTSSTPVKLDSGKPEKQEPVLNQMQRFAKVTQFKKELESMPPPKDPKQLRELVRRAKEVLGDQTEALASAMASSKSAVFSPASQPQHSSEKQLKTTAALPNAQMQNITKEVVETINRKPEVNQNGKLEILEGNKPQFTGKNPIAALANCDNTFLKQQKYTLTIPDNNEALANTLLKEAQTKGIQIDKVVIGKVEHAVSKDYSFVKQNENVPAAASSAVNPPPAKLK